jgi:transcriptional regulator with XRE-family HTH domain
MVQIPEVLHEKIKTIRMSLHFSIHDCAKLLGLPQGEYLAFERGEQHLSLPDLEILALYFGLPLEAFFNDKYKRLYQLTLLQDGIRPQYQLLRQKIIRTQLVLERQSAGLTLEELEEATDIPLDVLRNYEEETVPIPIDHLQLICQHLGKHLDTFFPDELQVSESLLIPSVPNNNGDGPEFSAQDEDLDGSFTQIIAKLKEIPKEAQAEIAKDILHKLKDN